MHFDHIVQLNAQFFTRELDSVPKDNILVQQMLCCRSCSHDPEAYHLVTEPALKKKAAFAILDQLKAFVAWHIFPLINPILLCSLHGDVLRQAERKQDPLVFMAFQLLLVLEYLII